MVLIFRVFLFKRALTNMLCVKDNVMRMKYRGHFMSTNLDYSKQVAILVSLLIYHIAELSENFNLLWVDQS